MKPARQTSSKVSKLREVFDGKNTMLIVMQDNPDPDSIASAIALKRLANNIAGIQCSIAHGGTVGRGENRALVRYLGINLRQCTDVALNKFDLVALVDTQPGTGNNSLPLEVIPQIVIDHHPRHKLTHSCEFTDIRKNYGATSTILCEYLKEAEIAVDPPLATALLYGIRSDTQDLGRQAGKPDVDAIGLLFPVANKKMLSNIQRGTLLREYFAMLSDALYNSKVYGNAIVSGMSYIDNPDMIAEVADMLLRDEQSQWTFCYGFYDNRMLISLRTNNDDGGADLVIRKVVARRGTGGGHAMYAGGQIWLGDRTKKQIAELEHDVVTKFLKLVGADAEHWERLVPEERRTSPAGEILFGKQSE